MNTALMENNSRATATAEMGGQYSLARILGLWALASVPGGLLFWLGLPFLDKHTGLSTSYLVLIVLVIPYFWQLLLSFCLLIFNWIKPWAAKRFKSYWVAVIIHGTFDTITLIILFTLAIMGMLQ